MELSQGELRQGSVAPLLEAAFQAQASGVLRLERGRELKKIFFHQGRIVLCLSNRRGEGLEQFVVAQGKLRGDELAELRAAAAAPGKNFLGALLSWQGIPGVAQEALLRDHASLLLQELLGWQQGQYAFQPGLPPALSHCPLQAAPQELLPAHGQEAALVERISGQILAGEIDLPPMPETMIRLHRALTDEKGSVDETVRLLSADQILTSTILRVVNSSFYSLAHPVTSIHHAVSYLGFRAVEGIVTARTLDAIFVRNREAVRAVLQQGFQVGCLARRLTVDLGGDGDEAFVCGLLHNIGKTVILNLEGEYGLSRKTGAGLADRYHQQVGVLLAAKWNLPEAVVETIEYLHAPASAPPGTSPTVVLVGLAAKLLENPAEAAGILDQLPAAMADKIDLPALQSAIPEVRQLAKTLL